MKMFLRFLFVFFCFGSFGADGRLVYPGLGALRSDSDGEIWAVLVAGSMGMFNYRHQADICHAYQVVRSHGVAEDHIITMLYDDVANSEDNPYPGKLINAPGGKDVYAGVRVDYRGDDVTAANFMAILRGKRPKGGNGRVLKSTANDRVFVFFADHGATGIIAFPEGPSLTAKELKQTLEAMHKEKRFRELLFYLEACESGSMFDGILRSDLNIFATTAANTSESSWGCYCDEEPEIGCLGDFYSVNWMEDSDKENLKTETLEKQFEIVKQKTKMSHVQKYGDSGMSEEPVADYQGEKTSLQSWGSSKPASESVVWPSREIPLRTLAQKRDKAENPTKRKQLQQQLLQMARQYFDEFVRRFVEKLVDNNEQVETALNKIPNLRNHLDCHYQAVHAFDRACYGFAKNEYTIVVAKVLANLCEMGISAPTMISEMMDHCLDHFHVGNLPSSSLGFSLGGPGDSFTPFTPNVPREESPEEAQRRFDIECEFVQSLANPNYLNYLAQRGYFKEQYFVNYLKYLLYWKRPEYARCIKFPQALFMLEAVQSAEFREAMLSSANAKYVEDQMLLQWHFYIRKRTRLFQFSQVSERQINKPKKRTPGRNAEDGEDGDGAEDGKSDNDDNGDDDSPMEEDDNVSPVPATEQPEAQREEEHENDENDETAGEPME